MYGNHVVVLKDTETLTITLRSIFGSFCTKQVQLKEGLISSS